MSTRTEESGDGTGWVTVNPLCCTPVLHLSASTQENMADGDEPLSVVLGLVLNTRRSGSCFLSELKSLPLPLLRYGTSIAMAADKEKRRTGVTSSGMPESKAAKLDSDREFLSQAGVGEVLRGAILKMVEARSDDPIGFLADHFCNLASVSETGAVGCGDGDQVNHSPLSGGAQEQQHLNRALWHLRLAHHSQRSVNMRGHRVGQFMAIFLRGFPDS